jgi:hypothetical protein
VTTYENSRQRRRLVIAFWLAVCICIAALSAYLGTAA